MGFLTFTAPSKCLIWRLRLPVPVVFLVLSVLIQKSVQKQIISNSTQTTYPFIDYISINPNNVIFYLYRSFAPYGQPDFDIITFNDTSSIENSKYNPNLPLTILVHGYTQNLLTAFPQELVRAYLQSGIVPIRTNLIVVDWAQLSGPRILSTNNADYNYVVQRTIPIVSQRVGDFVLFMSNSKKLDSLKNVHLFGQSLGAHVVGFAGKYIFQTTEERVGRITGSDPAGPGYQKAGPEDRIDKSDADFVDIIHTDEGVLGITGSIGHVDFYVNGGKGVQPGCEGPDTFCSHNRAYFYYAMSIRNPIITACKDRSLVSNCPLEKTVIFGENCQNSTRGDYYLNLVKVTSKAAKLAKLANLPKTQ